MGAYEVVRTITVHAPRARVHALVNDLHAWRAWSPWEDIDPAMEREHTGAQSGVGAAYAWSGNRKAGSGRMEITASTPDAIAIDLTFDRPFKARNGLAFELAEEGAATEEAGAATEVTWRMTGEQTGLMALVGRIYPMDKMVGKDFERGLRRLKATAEICS